jgi:hypothetical protein
VLPGSGLGQIVGRAFDVQAVAVIAARGIRVSQRDIVSEALTEMSDIWNVDPARSIPTDDGFDWWPGDFKVSVTAVRRIDAHIPETWMLSVKTDFLKDVPLTDSRFVQFATMQSRLASTHAWVYPPVEVFEHFSKRSDTPRLWLANTAYLTAKNAFWMPRFLADMSIVQPIDAHLLAASKPASLGGGKLDTSRPGLLGRSSTGRLLDEALAHYQSSGKNPSRWIGTGEFEEIAGQWHRPEHTFCKGNDLALSLVVRFDNGPAKIGLFTGDKHPVLGNGLLGVLDLQEFDNASAIATRCASLNLMETLWNDIPQFGCWCSHMAKDGAYFPHFVCFLPNRLYGRGIASQLVLWLYERARWVIDNQLPTDG